MFTFGDLIKTRGKEAAKKMIRKKSRQIYIESDKPKECENCGCSDCFEVHHIIPLADFPYNTPIKDMVNLTNLQALCPTCHQIVHQFL